MLSLLPITDSSGVLRFVMENGAKGCEVRVSGKLRAQRAKVIWLVYLLIISFWCILAQLKADNYGNYLLYRWCEKQSFMK